MSDLPCLTFHPPSWPSHRPLRLQASSPESPFPLSFQERQESGTGAGDPLLRTERTKATLTKGTYKAVTENI